MIKLFITYRVFLLPGELAGGLEVNAKVGIVAFVVLADVFDGIDMERYGEAMNGEDHCLGFPVHGDLTTA